MHSFYIYIYIYSLSQIDQIDSPGGFSCATYFLIDLGTPKFATFPNFSLAHQMMYFKKKLPWTAPGPVFGGHVRAFLTPNIHKVNKPQRVNVLSKMRVKIDGGIKFHGSSNVYQEFSKFWFLNFKILRKNVTFLSTAYVYF